MPRDTRIWKTVVLALVAPAVMLIAACGPVGRGAVAPSSSPTAPGMARPGALPPTSSQCRADRAAGTVRFASPFGYDASAGIIDVYAALKLGYFADLCLGARFVDVPVDESPYALVSAGTAQMTGEGSAADAMLQEASGSNFVGVSTYGDTSDYALLTVEKITKLTQLEGKVLAYHTILPVVLREMLVKAGVNLDKVHAVNDQSYNPLLLTHGSFSALQAYQSNEPVTLRADKVAFREWTPAQFGVKGTFNVQVVNRTFLSRHRVAAANFLRAELHAFDYCTAHGPECVGFLAAAQGPSFKLSHGEAEWRIESGLALHHHLSGKGVGVQSAAEWSSEAQALLHYKLVAKPVDLSRDEDTALAASLYRGTKLVWP